VESACKESAGKIVTFRPLSLIAELFWAPLAPGSEMLKLELLDMPAN